MSNLQIRCIHADGIVFLWINLTALMLVMRWEEIALIPILFILLINIIRLKINLLMSFRLEKRSQRLETVNMACVQPMV